MQEIKNKERYKRQISLEEFGEESQLKLFNSKVLVCGAGGLGSPALLYLAAAGIGTLGIADFDKVDLTNLQRQIIYNENDLGKSKAETSYQKLKVLNSDIKLNFHEVAISNENALELISQYHLVIDGSDNFETRYIVNDACVLLNKPLIYGAVLKFEGQVGVFNFSDGKCDFKTNYRDLFPIPPDPSKTQSCNEAGVLGVLPGIIGTMQATEAIKIITGKGKILTNQILTYNALTNDFYKFNLSPNSNNELPKTADEFKKFDYRWFCSSKNQKNEIDIESFKKMLETEKLTIIDIREIGEKPDTTDFEYQKMPMSRIYEYINDFTPEENIIVFCQTGKRSLSVAQILKEELTGKNIYSLKGGIVEWEKNKFNTSK